MESCVGSGLRVCVGVSAGWEGGMGRGQRHVSCLRGCVRAVCVVECGHGRRERAAQRESARRGGRAHTHTRARRRSVRRARRKPRDTQIDTHTHHTHRQARANEQSRERASVSYCISQHADLPSCFVRRVAHTPAFAAACGAEASGNPGKFAAVCRYGGHISG